MHALSYHSGTTPSANQTELSTDDASDSNGSSDATAIAAVVASVGVVLAITMCLVVTVVLVLSWRKSKTQEQVVELQGNAMRYGIR